MSSVDLEAFAAQYALEDFERWDDAIVVARRGRTGVVQALSRIAGLRVLEYTEAEFIR